MVAPTDALMQMTVCLDCLLCWDKGNMLPFELNPVVCVCYSLSLNTCGDLNNRVCPLKLSSPSSGWCLVLAVWIDRVLDQEDSLDCNSVMDWMLNSGIYHGWWVRHMSATQIAFICTLFNLFKWKLKLWTSVFCGRQRTQEDRVFPFRLLTAYRAGGEKWRQRASQVTDTFFLKVKASSGGCGYFKELAQN